MGMFDDIKCKYPLPLAGANDLDYQTKDTDRQFCDHYEIREDGTLWHEDYDIEDHSEAGKWQKEHPGQKLPDDLGLDAFCGCMSRVNKRWGRVEFTGEIRFYNMYSIDQNGKMVDSDSRDGWLEWSAYFANGKLNQINLVENRLPESNAVLADGQEKG